MLHYLFVCGDKLNVDNIIVKQLCLVIDLVITIYIKLQTHNHQKDVRMEL